MNVSTKSEYGLRALMQLASEEGQRSAISARAIAERWNVPVKYLEQILKALRESGFVESQLGVGGGYRLARPADEIVVGDVIRVLDGRIAPMGCVSAYEYVACEFEPECNLKRLWARTRRAMLEVLDATSVADLCGAERTAASPRRDEDTAAIAAAPAPR